MVDPASRSALTCVRDAFPGGPQRLHSLFYASDVDPTGTYVGGATAFPGGKGAVLDLRTGALAWTTHGIQGWCCAFSPDGRDTLTFSSDPSSYGLFVLDASDGSYVTTLRLPQYLDLYEAGWDHDQVIAVVAATTDSATTHAIVKFDLHSGAATSGDSRSSPGPGAGYKLQPP